MRTFICIILLLIASPSYAVTAFLKDEIVTGNTKQCVYDFAGNKYVRTVKSYALCPLSIQV